MKYVKDISVMLEQLDPLEGGQIELEPAPLAYKYVKGKDMMATKQEVNDLPTSICCKAGVSSFSFFIPECIYHIEKPSDKWIKIVALFQYQRCELDVQIMGLWSM